jgi:hypothetical protein
MGYWGVRSYEVDEVWDVLDQALEQVHGDRYVALMDDKNPTPAEKVQDQLANAQSLAAALAILEEDEGEDSTAWDELARLIFVGLVVRHAELGVVPSDEARLKAISFLEGEELDWSPASGRERRRQEEILLLKQPRATRTHDPRRNGHA